MKVNCVVVDDDALSIEIIVDYLSKIPNMNLLKTYNDPIEALQNINFKKIDTIFLDIDMPNINGIEFIKNVPENIPVIFTSAHTEYAMESYELNVLDYLVKPFPFVRFLKSIEKLKVYLCKSKSISKSIFVKCDKKLVQIFFDDILYIESLKDYICVVTTTDKYIVYNSLTKFTEELPANNFLRIHKSYTIALAKIQALNGNFIEVKMNKIPVGRAYLLSLKKYISSNF